MDMLVGIDVAYSKAARLNASYLGDRFGLNIPLANAAAHKILNETCHRWPEHVGFRAQRIYQRWHFLRMQVREAIDKHYVAADGQRRLAKSEMHRLVKGRTIRHQGGRAQRASPLQLYHCAVYTWSQTKIIRIDDQALHCR